LQKSQPGKDKRNIKLLEVERASCQIRRGAIKGIKQASGETGPWIMGEIP
jgi:hypothetical protein